MIRENIIRDNGFLTSFPSFLLPKGTSVRMPVQREHEDDDLILVLGIPTAVEPLGRPLITRNPHPDLLSLQASLRVSADSPSLTSKRFPGSSP